MNPILTKAFEPGAAISPYRFTKFDSDDDTVIQAAAVTDSIMGVSNHLGAAATDTRVDVHVAGIVEVEFGGNVTRGAKVTSDGDGKAVAAAPAQGVNNQIGGIAMCSGVSGDIGKVLLAPSVMQGA